MSREQAQTFAVIIVITLYALTGSELAMAAAVVTALSFLFPTHWYPRMAGYVVLCDLFASWYIFSSFMGVAAVSAASIGVFASLGISVFLRVLRVVMGAERLSIDGDTSLRAAFTALVSQGMRWTQAILAGATTGKVIAPKPLAFTWVTTQEGVGLIGALRLIFPKFGYTN